MKTSNKAYIAKNMFNLSLMCVYLHVINLQNRKEQDIYTGVKQPKLVTEASSLKLLKRYQKSVIKLLFLVPFFLSPRQSVKVFYVFCSVSEMGFN